MQCVAVWCSVVQCVAVCRSTCLLAGIYVACSCRDMTCSYAWHDLFICVTWLVHMRDMTCSYAWHGSFICVTWLIYTLDMTRSYAWHKSFICATWLVHMRDLTCSCHDTQHRSLPTNKHCNTLQHTATHCNTLQYTATQCNALQRTATHCNTLQRTATHCNTHVTHMDCNTTDFWLRMSWLLMRRLVTVITLQHTATHCDTLQHTAYNCNTTHFLLHVVIAHVMTGAITNESYYNPYVRHDSFTCVTWFIHLCGTTHLFVGRNSFIRWTWLVHMCDMTRSYACHDSFIRVTRLVLMRDMIHMRDMIYVHVHVGHDSFHFFFFASHVWSHMYVWCPVCDAYVIWRINVTYASHIGRHICVMSYMWRICDIWFGELTSHMRHICVVNICVTSQMCDVQYVTHMWHMVWRFNVTYASHMRRHICDICFGGLICNVIHVWNVKYVLCYFYGT